MKKLLTLLFIGTLSIAYSQEVPEVQKSLLSKISADWCSNCGGWGWGFWKDLIDDNAGNAVFMSVHHSGGLETPTSNALASNFQIFGQPRFFLDNEDQYASSGNTGSKRTDIKNMVNANTQLSPVANAGLNAVLDGNLLTVNTKSRFFQNSNGSFYIGLYLVEDYFVSYQASQGSNAQHRYLLHTGMSGNDHFGVFIDEGNIASGSEYNHQFSITLDNAWNLDHLSVVAIIWEEVNGVYQVVNVNETNTFGVASSVSSLLSSELSLTVSPTISDRDVRLDLDLKKSFSDVQITLIDPNGRSIQRIFNGPLFNGLHHFTIPQVTTPGMYFVFLQTNEGILTERVIFQ